MQRSELIFAQAAVLGFSGYGYPTGASEPAIAELERVVGRELPPGLRDMYRVHDGEVIEHGKDSPALFFGLEFISLTHIVTIREGFIAGQAADDEFPGMNEYRSHPPGKVREVYYSRGWVPFAGLYTADQFAIDFDPAPGGIVGQVILFGADHEARICLASSFDEFLMKVFEAYSHKRLHPAFGWSLNDLYSLDLT